MYKFGTIVLVPFPFTNLEQSTVRPALIISRKNKSDDVILAFITTKQEKNGLFIDKENPEFSQSGLKVPSTIRFDKIATLHKKIILGELGYLSPKYLQNKKSEFLKHFGF